MKTCLFKDVTRVALACPIIITNYALSRVNNKRHDAKSKTHDFVLRNINVFIYRNSGENDLKIDLSASIARREYNIIIHLTPD